MTLSGFNVLFGFRVANIKQHRFSEPCGRFVKETNLEQLRKILKLIISEHVLRT